MTLGLGLLIGRVGLVSLCQFVLLSVGAWVAVRFDQMWPWLPFPAVLLIAGVVTGLIGTLIGLPALRLSGLYLALITLMAAGAITVLLKVQQFPNGGGGFWGRSRGGGPISQISRPSIALGDTAFYRYCVVVAIVMFLIAFWHVKRSRGARGRPSARAKPRLCRPACTRPSTSCGRSRSLRSSPASPADCSPRRRGVNINQFPIQQSIQIYAVVLVGGVYTLSGAVVGGLVFQLVPALFRRWGIGIELFTILFGIGVLQVLLTAPGGIVEQVPHDFGNLGKKLIGGVTGKGKSKAPTASQAPAAVPGVEAAEPTA